MKNGQVLILLAAYNGEEYVREMIDSVLTQDYENIHLILSDDHSSDSTLNILREYAEKNPERVTHYCSGQRFGCAQKHFMHLLKTFHDAPYIMFCDQDDVWHRDKISKTLKAMQNLEAGQDTPALIHTDLRVVDRDLKEISPSFCSHSQLDGNRVALNQLLVQNVVTGCTMMLNHALAVLACREGGAEKMMMHDWWIALLSASCGKIGFLPEATIDYRQHGNNSVGAKNVRSPGYILQRLRSQSMRDSLAKAARQAGAFADVYEDCLSMEQKEMLCSFAKTPELSWRKRNRVYRKYKLYKYGFLRKSAQILGW